MKQIFYFILFILIAFFIYFVMHYFVFRSITKFIDFSAKTKSFIKIFFIFSALTLPLGVLLSRIMRIHFLSHYAYVWLGIIAISFSVFLIERFIVMIFPSKARLFTIVAMLLVALISVYSFLNCTRSPVVKKITIPLKKLPAEMSGFSIVQLSDLHLEEYKSTNMIVKIVDTVNSLNPDLIVITGDLISGDTCKDYDFCEPLKKLKSFHGVISVTGNHEFYAGIHTFLKLAQDLNIKVLRNERISILNTLQIIGLEDDEGKRFVKKGPDLDSAIKGCDLKKPIILLYHRPGGFDKAVKKGVDLQISGHTHAGQIPPMDILVRLFYKYPYGLYENNGSYIYTSCGTGYWGPPMHLFSRPEIVQFILVSKE